jgi:hypothetical protein
VYLLGDVHGRPGHVVQLFGITVPNFQLVLKAVRVVFLSVLFGKLKRLRVVLVVGDELESKTFPGTDRRLQI